MLPLNNLIFQEKNYHLFTVYAGNLRICNLVDNYFWNTKYV